MLPAQPPHANSHRRFAGSDACTTIPLVFACSGFTFSQRSRHHDSVSFQSLPLARSSIFMECDAPTISWSGTTPQIQP